MGSRGQGGATVRERRISRRQFLPGAAGLIAVGAAGVAGYELHGNGQAKAPDTQTQRSVTTPANAAAPGTGAQSFVTRPDLRPPAIRVTDLDLGWADATSPRFIALAPITVVSDPDAQLGPMLLDRRGRLVWFEPLRGSTFDLNVQTYNGSPVLSYWHGQVIGSHGVGTATLLGGDYRSRATIEGTKTLPLDLHELNLTSRGTALVTSYVAESADLSAVGGPRKGEVWDGHAIEIEIASGKVLFDWSSLDHVGVEDSYKRFQPGQKNPYDYFHLNSICELDDGHLLISSRNTWCLYKVDRSTGEVIWRINGKQSDFEVSSAARFSWQHHVRSQGSSGLTLFDNANNTGNRSRGLVLDYNATTRRVDLVHAYEHPAAFLSETLGSVQLLPSGEVFVGWGAQPYFSGFAEPGTQLSDGEFPVGLRSYRTFLVDWTGQPSESPAIVARANPAGGFVVYASWNGATEIDRWVVLAGKSRSALEQIGSQPWTGFETVIAVNSSGPYFAVAAVDRSGREIGRSEVI